jgi:hypothetical protein
MPETFLNGGKNGVLAGSGGNRLERTGSAGIGSASESRRHPAEHRQHDLTRGADQAITSAIDSHVQVEQCGGEDDDDGQAGVLAPVG